MASCYAGGREEPAAGAKFGAARSSTPSTNVATRSGFSTGFAYITRGAISSSQPTEPLGQSQQPQQQVDDNDGEPHAQVATVSNMNEQQQQEGGLNDTPKRRRRATNRDGHTPFWMASSGKAAALSSRETSKGIRAMIL